MGFLDGLFDGAAQLPFAPKVVTADSVLALEWIHQINMEPSGGALVVTLANETERESKRVGVKVVGQGDGPGVLTVAAPSGQLIESDEGVLASVVQLRAARGVYREYGCVGSAWRCVGAIGDARLVAPTTHLATVDQPVEVGSSGAPVAGDVLTASGAEAASWQAPAPAASLALSERTPVYVASGSSPSSGDVLTATGPSDAEWQWPPPASALFCGVESSPVAIAAGPTPAAGAVLTATGPSAAIWQSSIKLTTAKLAAMSGEMWFPPSVPHARDIEFSSEVLPADLVWANAAMTPITPLNNEALTRYSSPTSLPRYKVHTQRRPSWLQWQTPKDGAFRYLYVPFDMPVGGCVWIRMHYGLFCNSYTAGAPASLHEEAGFRLALLADAAGKPDVNNQVFVQQRHETSPSNAASFNRQCRGGCVQTGSEIFWDGQAQLGTWHGAGTYFGIHRAAANSYDAWIGQESGAWQSLVDMGTLTSLGQTLWGPSTPKYIGIRFGCASGAQGGRLHPNFSLDFIRVSTAPILPW